MSYEDIGTIIENSRNQMKSIVEIVKKQLSGKLPEPNFNIAVQHVSDLIDFALAFVKLDLEISLGSLYLKEGAPLQMVPAFALQQLKSMVTQMSILINQLEKMGE